MIITQACGHGGRIGRGDEILGILIAAGALARGASLVLLEGGLAENVLTSSGFLLWAELLFHFGAESLLVHQESPSPIVGHAARVHFLSFGPGILLPLKGISGLTGLPCLHEGWLVLGLHIVLVEGTLSVVV